MNDFEASYIQWEGIGVVDMLSKYARWEHLWNKQQGFRLALEHNSADLRRLPYSTVDKEQEILLRARGWSTTRHAGWV